MLATIESDDDALQVRRSNGPYRADIRAGVGLWGGMVVFFCGIDLASYALIWGLHRMGGAPLSPFLPPNQLLLFVSLMAAAVLVNLIPVFAGLRSPQVFTFDAGHNAFLVEGRVVGRFDHLRLLLQDSFGPSRRALRLIVRAGGTDYVIAHTQRFTTATLSGKEYPSVAAGEGLQRRYWFNQWADYTGAKTGFSREWPEYREIFALYAELKEFVEVPEIEASYPNSPIGGKGES